MCLLQKSTFIIILIVFGMGTLAGMIFGFIFHGAPWKALFLDKNWLIDNRPSREFPENWTWTVAELENDSLSLDELQNIEKYCNLQCGGKSRWLLKLYPVFDGHNDLAWNIRKMTGNQMDRFNLSKDLRRMEGWKNSGKSHTDIPRLRMGQVGAQFWVAYAPCESQGKDAVVQTLEQIDLIRRLIERYNDDLEFCGTAKCVARTSFNRSGHLGEGGKIASLIGVEGGHLIQNSAGVLRQFYRLGVRYMTLTHSCNTAWANASPVDGAKEKWDYVLGKVNPGGISGWGMDLIGEMNRIGMIVDLSHVSEDVMIAAIWRSRAPVIFSHSGAKAVCNVHRNVGDRVLEILKKNGGVIMINFYSDFLYCDQGNPRRATINDVVQHIEHVRNVTGGTDNIGLGADYDGMELPAFGLEDVSRYPELFSALIFRGWKLMDLRKIGYLNMLRVMEGVERVKREMARNKNVKILESTVTEEELMQKGILRFDKKNSCLSNYSLAKKF